ncbi:glycosyltransferase family 2 protein [Weeksellaceae bacterium A-14]
MHIDISVIIINYNTLEMTKACIDSVFQYTKDVSFEIILVDNASNDGSKEYFEQEGRVRYIFSDENLGFGRANNLGYEYAQGKYLFLLNSDTLLLNNALYDFFCFAEKSEYKIGCIGCILKDKDLKSSTSYGKFPSFLSSFEEWIIYPVLHKIGINYKLGKYDYKLSGAAPYKVEYVTGAALFVKKSIPDKYGLFDPDFFMYYEETDMQFRYRKLGFSSVVINDPQIIHFMGGSSDVVRKISKKRFPLQSLFLFFKKHRSRFSYNCFVFLFLLLYFPFVFLSPYKKSDKILLIRNILNKNFY